MIPLSRIPVWTYWHRRRFLRRFRKDLETYFGEVSYEAFPFRVVENERAAALRKDLEGELKRCRSVVRAAGHVSPLRLAPGDQEGEVVRVNVITEAFRLHRHNLRKQDLLDVLDAADQAYRAGRRAAWIRTLNPLYWLDMGLSVVEVLPFLTLRLVGVDWRRVARSRGGGVVRVALRAVVLVGLVLAVLQLAGLRQWALESAVRVYHVARGIPGHLLGS